MTDKVQKILSEIVTRKLCTMDEHMAFYNDKAKEDYRFLSEIEELIKALKEEPVSEELEEEISRCILDEDMNFDSCARHFANWQKEQMMKTAVDGKIYETQVRSKLKAATIGKISRLKYRVGDKVKLIILKED